MSAEISNPFFNKVTVMVWFRSSRSFSKKKAARKTKLKRSLQLELLEERTVPSVTINNNYPGIDFPHSQGYVPPDTSGAAGPSNYLETVNQEITIYNPKATGAQQLTDSLSHFWFTSG